MKKSRLWRTALVVLVPFCILSAVLFSSHSLAPAGAQEEVKLELVGQIGGETNAVYVVDNYAYIGVGPKLVILDISDPANPAEIGHIVLPVLVRDIYAVGNYVYVTSYTWRAFKAEEGSLHVISIADKANPVKVGSCNIPGGAHNVYVAEDYAYVAAGDAGLRIISVADKSNPTEVSFFDTAGEAEGVYVIGDYAYVSIAREVYASIGEPPPEKAGLHIISVADKSNPTEVSFLDIPSEGAYLAGGHDVQVVGDYAYIAAGDGGLHIISIADKSNPTEVGCFATPMSVVRRVYVIGDYAYTTGLGLLIISVADKARPVEVGSYTPSLPGFFRTSSIHIVGDYAYVAAGEYGLRIVSVADKSNPTEVGFRGTLGYVKDICVDGDYAYVVDSNSNVLDIISVADKANPARVSFFDIPGDAGQYRSVHVAGDYVYIGLCIHGEPDLGLYIISVADKSSPTEVSCFKACVGDVYVVGDYAYIIAGAVTGARLCVISVVDKSNPTLLGCCHEISSGAWEVYVSGDYGYVAAPDGLHIISVTDKSNPTEVGFWATPTVVDARHVHVVGDYAYLAAGDGLHVVSIADKANPTEVGFCEIPGWTHDIYVAGDYAYVTAYRAGLRVISVADKSNPVEVGFFDTLGDAQDVHVVGDYVYVADGIGGLLILRIVKPEYRVYLPIVGPLVLR